MAWLKIIGIGEDGITGLSDEARRIIRDAKVIFGGTRHLALLPADPIQKRIPWPHPFAAAYEQLLTYRGRSVCVLASGDPMFYGIGGELSARLEPYELFILPSSSSLSLAAARLGWALQDVSVFPAHRKSLNGVLLNCFPNARLLVLTADGRTPAQLAAVLTKYGYGASQLIVFERLGGEHERCLKGRVRDWPYGDCAALNLCAVICHIEDAYQPLSRRCSLPDHAYLHDGQLTKQDIRAATLARLAPMPGELLWDVGAGCGSIGIEWMRAEASCRAFAIEANATRQELLTQNSIKLGVPELVLIPGAAPQVLENLELPDAIFIGGGLTKAGVVDTCWRALKPNGRLVANAVTLQSETMLNRLHAQFGGELTRFSVAHVEPLGHFDGWRPAMPVTIFSTMKRTKDDEQLRCALRLHEAR